MLSEDERQSFIEDGWSRVRQAAFRAARQHPTVLTFEAFLDWLDEFQCAFGPFPVSRRISRTALNKL